MHNERQLCLGLCNHRLFVVQQCLGDPVLISFLLNLCCYALREDIFHVEVVVYEDRTDWLSEVPVGRVRAERNRMTFWRSNAKPVSELRNWCTYHFMLWRLPAPFVSAGLGTLQAGLPEASVVAGVLRNSDLQCVINESRDLGTNHRNAQNIRALGVMLPGSWHCILFSSQVEQSQNYVFILEYFLSLPQNEGSKVYRVKVEKIARMCKSFSEKQIISVSFAHVHQW